MQERESLQPFECSVESIPYRGVSIFDLYISVLVIILIGIEFLFFEEYQRECWDMIHNYISFSFCPTWIVFSFLMLFIFFSLSALSLYFLTIP